jgi:hypothetical protein
LVSKRQDSSLAAIAGDDSKKIVPKVPGINQRSFKVLSPDSHLWEPLGCENIDKSSQLYHRKFAFDGFLTGGFGIKT